MKCNKVVRVFTIFQFLAALDWFTYLFGGSLCWTQFCGCHWHLIMLGWNLVPELNIMDVIIWYTDVSVCVYWFYIVLYVWVSFIVSAWMDDIIYWRLYNVINEILPCLFLWNKSLNESSEGIPTRLLVWFYNLDISSVPSFYQSNLLHFDMYFLEMFHLCWDTWFQINSCKQLPRRKFTREK